MDLPHQLFYKEKGDKWEDKLTRKEKDIPSLDLEAWQDSVFNAVYYVVVFTIMHIFNNCRSPICKGKRVVKDGIQGREETQEMFCLCFYVAKIAWQ